MTNTLLHSLFSQCTIAFNGETVTPAADYYNYLAYLETILTYRVDAAVSHLTKCFWYLDDGDLLPCDHTFDDVKKVGIVTRWKRLKQSRRSSCTAGCTATYVTCRDSCSPASAYRSG